ncbi:MAG: hypothetical protein IPJ55_18980 [Chloracidobacterium sp.]|nr:hypothetical protein [Chloracidobacterium sp.]
MHASLNHGDLQKQSSVIRATGFTTRSRVVALARNADRVDQPDARPQNLTMTMRYAAVMPPLLRQEFETAFVSISGEHGATAQIRVLLSPEAHRGRLNGESPFA